MPQLVAFTKTCFRSNPSRWLIDPSQPSVLEYVPQKQGSVIQVFFGTKHICDAPTCRFHDNLFLVELVKVAHRSYVSISARISAQKKGPTISPCLRPSIFVMPQPLAFKNLFLVELVTVAQRLKTSKSAQLSPAKKGPASENVCNLAYLGCPNT